MFYFRGIIAAGWAGMITCGASTIATASLRWGWQGAVATSSAFLLSLWIIYKGGMHAMETLGNGPKKKKRGSSSGGSSNSSWHKFSSMSTAFMAPSSKYKSAEPTLQGTQGQAA